MSFESPPPYEVGKIYGKAEDIAKAREVLARYNPGANIIAAWSVDPKLISQMKKWGFCTQCLFLPIACPALPCMVTSLLNNLERLRHTIYILTEDGFITSLSDCRPPCACSTTGNDFKEVLFEYMGDISVNNRGTGCCSSCTTPSVSISLPGQVTMSDDVAIVNSVTVLTLDPVGVAHLIRQARRAHLRSERAAGAASVVVQQPTTNKRVVVALSTTPNAVKVVTISESTAWTAFVDEASKKLGFTGRVARVELQLPAGSGSLEISTLSDVQNNDKVLFLQ
jgi:hypothetical protein